MCIARSAGAKPASIPSTDSSTTAPMAVQKSIWKCADVMPSVVFAISSPCSTSTTKRMPLMPATEVSKILSCMICDSISRGVAPMARRMPISTVRSRTVTIMMFDTPMAPASSVPIPTSHISMLMPRNILSTIENIISVLNTITPFSSFGLTS